MSTCQQVINIAYEKIGVIGAGASPEAGDSARALQSLKSYYQKLINSGAFGSLYDVIPSDTAYEAGENERIVHDGTVTVTLPEVLPAYYEHSSYGMISLGTDIGQIRPPRDLSVISEVRTDTGAIKDYLYDNRVREWIDVNALVAGDYAPLSHRDEDGLASALAVRVAPHFGQQPSQDVQLAAIRFEEALTHNWSQAGEIIEPRDYF